MATLLTLVWTPFFPESCVGSGPSWCPEVPAAEGGTGGSADGNFPGMGRKWEGGGIGSQKLAKPPFHRLPRGSAAGKL